MVEGVVSQVVPGCPTCPGIGKCDNSFTMRNMLPDRTLNAKFYFHLDLIQFPSSGILSSHGKSA